MEKSKDPLTTIYAETLNKMAQNSIHFANFQPEDAKILEKLFAQITSKHLPTHARQLYSNYLLEKEEFDSALEQLKILEALEVDPINTNTDIALCLYKMERYQDALPYLEKTTTQYPTDTLFGIMHAYALLIDGQKQAAYLAISNRLENLDHADFKAHEKEIKALFSASLNAAATVNGNDLVPHPSPLEQ